MMRLGRCTAGDHSHESATGGAEEAVKTTMQSVSQRSLHRILSRLHVDTCGRPNTTPIEFLLIDDT